MKDSKRYFHPETIKRISRLELRAKYIVEGCLSGMHRSPFFGQSVEFRQHRDYVPGDDPKHVDWKLWGRQDKLYVKQFEEETTLNCHLLVDQSESMFYASGLFSKYEFAATIACCLAFLVIRQNDSVGCALFDSSITRLLPCRNRASQLSDLASLLNSEKGGKKTSITAVMDEFSTRLNKRGLVVVVSDFLEDVHRLKRGFELIRRQGHDLLLIHLLDREEVEFSFNGPTHFEGMEKTGDIKCNPEAFRDAYCEALAEYRHELMQLCSTVSADYEFCTTDTAFNTVLSSLLSRRLSRQQKI